MAFREFLGYSLWASGGDALAVNVHQHITDGSSFKYAACLNPHSFVVALSQGHFVSALRGASWLLPDGAGVAMGATALDFRILDRVPGLELFVSVMNLAATRTQRLRVFLLGSTRETLELLRLRVMADFRNVDVVGVLSPPFADKFSIQQTEEMVRAINASQCHVLWVAMTAPKQEVWLFEARELLRVPFAGAIGAVFDYYAGVVQVPPRFARALGLEWVWRFYREPSRMWRRYLVSSPIFVWTVMRCALRKILLRVSRFFAPFYR